MVLELALLDVTPGNEAAFAEGYRKVKPALAESAGLLSVRMTQGVETATRFVLMVEWESVEAHQAFRDSDRYAIWRAGIGSYFDGQPRVEHFTDLS